MPKILTNTQISVIEFWRQFGVPVYEQGDANTYDMQGNPIPAPFPYITFSAPFGDYFQNDLMTAQVWTRSTSNMPLFGILDKIEQAIPAYSGTVLHIYDYDLNTGKKISTKPIGAYAVYRSTPFINPYPQEDPIYRVRVVTVVVRNYIKGA